MKQFRRIADATASALGSPGVFSATVALTAIWLILGPVFRFSDTWQLTMNTIASQVTFLVALLLQNTQNRDTRALHLKLDELLRSSAGARDQLISLSKVVPLPGTFSIAPSQARMWTLSPGRCLASHETKAPRWLGASPASSFSTKAMRVSTSHPISRICERARSIASLASR